MTGIIVSLLQLLLVLVILGVVVYFVERALPASLGVPFRYAMRAVFAIIAIVFAIWLLTGHGTRGSFLN